MKTQQITPRSVKWKSKFSINFSWKYHKVHKLKHETLQQRVIYNIARCFLTTTTTTKRAVLQHSFECNIVHVE